MSGFTTAWLDLRESADLRARDANLARQASAWLAGPADNSASDAIVVDLGAGTGSTLRTLARHGAANVVWRLVDHDGALLDEALRRHGRTCRIEAYQADLNRLDALPLGGARLVTASALFDLTSAAFVASLVARLVRRRPDSPATPAANPATGLYAALNYDGNMAWTPTHPLDASVLAAFNQDQRRDKGLGPALGPDAANYLQSILESSGFDVCTGASPWQLGSADHTLVRELVQGIAGAVAAGGDVKPDALAQWQRFRLAHAADGNCTVGHRDILALPVTGR